ncbi:MAG: glycoside hydrolase family 97 protein [Ignavibacteria bacterium]|jgi:alpha-glucosidase
MIKYLTSITIFVIISLVVVGCKIFTETTNILSSPSNNITVEFILTNDSSPNYLIRYKNEVIIDTSMMGFEFANQPSLINNLKLLDAKQSSFNEMWELPWGEQHFVSNHYNELIVEFEEEKDPGRKLNICFRVYDDGVGFRYEFPEQESMDTVIIMNELTQFSLTGDHTCWWTPGDWDIYEHLYNTTKFSEIDALSKAYHTNLLQTYIPENAVNTPVTMRTDDGLYLGFHEANLTDYAGMTLKVDKRNLRMVSELVGSDRSGYKVKRVLPFKTPWRTIQISDNAKGLIESNLILNLNEPNKLKNTSWIKPQKYVGIWWEMHIGKSNWNYGSGRHGATTENAKRYIDFAAANNISGVLVEGWNTGWELNVRENRFDFVTPYPDYDLEEVVRYGKEKGVGLIMHNETFSAPRTYEKQLDTAFALMKKLGIHSVKTGYVGKIMPEGEYHHGQWMVNHYRKVMEKAAEYEVMVDVHEPIKPTGLRRTYPNLISAEGLRGQEFNAWSSDGGNPPEHLTIVPFTRMLAGPIDYTPGIFDIKFDKYKPNNQVNTTTTHQLALYVVIFSPLQMAADLPENYIDHPAFQFIRDVGVDWDTTIVLNGEIGEFITTVRKERNTDNWFLGSITDENERTINISLNFLDGEIQYDAIIYSDDEHSHWDKNPTAYKIKKRTVDMNDTIEFKLAPGGGTAISFIPLNN